MSTSSLSCRSASHATIHRQTTRLARKIAPGASAISTRQSRSSTRQGRAGVSSALLAGGRHGPGQPAARSSSADMYGCSGNSVVACSMT